LHAAENFPFKFNVIWVVQPLLQKYIPSRLPQIKSITRAVSSQRGAIAIVTNAGRDAVDAAAPARLT
jgi:hypothetical protein